MHNKLMKEKEMLNKLNNDLEEINIFLIGSTDTKDCEEQNEHCLQDIMINNLQIINRAMALTNIIKETLKGGNN